MTEAPSTSTNLMLVQPKYVPAVWPHVLHLIESIANESRGRFQAEDFFNECMLDRFQLWIATTDNEVKAVMLTRIVQFPRLKAVELIALVGEDRETWAGHMPKILEWAKSLGCTLAQSVARVGWERVVKPFGFEKTHVFLEMPIG
jgi:hypothetical protein